jgi:hypothetical protein
MEFLSLYDIFTSLSAFSTDDFINCSFHSPRKCGDENAHFRQSTDRRWDWFLRWFNRLCQLNGWLEPFALKSCHTENRCLQNICFYDASLACTILKLLCSAHLILNTSCTQKCVPFPLRMNALRKAHTVHYQEISKMYSYLYYQTHAVNWRCTLEKGTYTHTHIYIYI